MTLYDFNIKDRTGLPLSMEEFRGKVLLIVNTATACGFTPQYRGLQKLYEKYQLRGFEILDFPCNQFAGQAPGSSEEIHNSCTGRFGITFRQFQKINVNGKNEEPLFGYLKKARKGLLGSRIKWNFTKFLADRNGQIVKRFSPSDTPEKIDVFIAELLGKN